MSAALVLPFVLSSVVARYGSQPPIPTSELPPEPSPEPVEGVAPEIAFYRKYTEALLRRYLRCSMEAGKVPSLLGKEMFRAKVSNYRMESFEDIIIFIHDVERCISRLDEDQQELIARISLQEYNVPETAEMLGLRPKTVVRLYREAIDRLTLIFLAVEMLQPQILVKRQKSPEVGQVIEMEGEKKSQNPGI